MRQLCRRLALLACVASGGHAKVISGMVKLSSQDTEEYITKSSFSPYVRSHINGSFHTDNGQYFDIHPHDLTLCLYDDKQWAKFMAATKKGSLCIERRQLATWAGGHLGGQPGGQPGTGPAGRSVGRPAGRAASPGHLQADARADRACRACPPIVGGQD